MGTHDLFHVPTSLALLCHALTLLAIARLLASRDGVAKRCLTTTPVEGKVRLNDAPCIGSHALFHAPTSLALLRLAPTTLA